MDRTDLPVRIYIPGKSAKLADNYGLVFKIRENQLRMYAMENFDPTDMKAAGSLWIYFNFLNEVMSNVTGEDLTPDRDVLYAEFTSLSADDSETKAPKVLHTFKELLHRCSVFGMDACEPDELKLADGTIWEESLAVYINRAEQKSFDDDLIQLKGGKAEGNYLHFNLESWTYPNGVIRIDPEYFEAVEGSDIAQSTQITIPNREVYWCYHLIQSDSSESPLVTITAKSSDDGNETLPEFEQIEPIGFTGAKKAMRFCTTSPVAMRNRYPFTIELEDQNKSDQARILPYPGAQVLSSIERSGKDELCSDIYLYL
jgi:hypothetical protein